MWYLTFKLYFTRLPKIHFALPILYLGKIEDNPYVGFHKKRRGRVVRILSLTNSAVIYHARGVAIIDTPLLSERMIVIDRRIIRQQLSTTFQKELAGLSLQIRQAPDELLFLHIDPKSSISNILLLLHTAAAAVQISQNYLSFPSKASYFCPRLNPFLHRAFTPVIAGGGGGQSKPGA